MSCAAAQPRSLEGTLLTTADIDTHLRSITCCLTAHLHAECHVSFWTINMQLYWSLKPHTGAMVHSSQLTKSNCTTHPMPKQSCMRDIPTKLSDITAFTGDILEQGMQLALEDKQATVEQLPLTVLSYRFGWIRHSLCWGHCMFVLTVDCLMLLDVEY